jgi:16S rRNA (guanine966-N2)-methyltransferase
MFRIIAGAARGLRLPVPDRPGVRPTTDRVRESLFSALQSRADLAGRRALDLFAGAGALGFEALSRGAETLDLVDRDVEVARTLRRSAARLPADLSQRVTVHAAPVERFLATCSAAPYGLVLLDPPYGMGRVAPTLAALAAGRWLRDDAWIAVESASTDEVVAPPGLCVHFARQYGQTLIALLSPEEP